MSVLVQQAPSALRILCQLSLDQHALVSNKRALRHPESLARWLSHRVAQNVAV